MSSRTLPDKAVRAIFFRFGSPRASDSAKVQRLLGSDFWRQRRLKGIYHRLQHCRTGSIQKLFHHVSAIVRVFCREPDGSAGMSKLGEVNRMQANAILRIPQENRLFPLDLAERVVLDNDYFDGKLVFHGSHKVGHEHGKSAIAKRNPLPLGICHLCRNGTRKPRRAAFSGEYGKKETGYAAEPGLSDFLRAVSENLPFSAVRAVLQAGNTGFFA